MWVLLRWLFRTVRANALRTASTVAGIAASFMLLAFSEELVYNYIASVQTDGKGLLRALVYYVAALILISPVHWLYISVLMEERKRQYHVFFSTGANNWQMLKCIAVETVFVELTGAIPGIAIGTAAASLALQKIVKDETIQFTLDMPSMLLVMSLQMLFVFCAMMFNASTILLLEKWKLEPKYPRRPAVRSRLIKRFCGIGAVLGDALCKKDEKHYTECMPSLVASVCALVLLASMFSTIGTLYSVQSDCAVSLNYSVDDASHEYIMSVIDDAVQSGEIGTAMTIRTYKPRVYCFFPENLMSAAYLSTRSQWSLIPKSSLFGNSCHLQQWRESLRAPLNQREMLFPRLVFYDNTSFAQLCADNGIDDPNAQALLYNVGQARGKRVPLLSGVPSGDTELIFFESAAEWDDDDSDGSNLFLNLSQRAADKEEQKLSLGRFRVSDFRKEVRTNQKCTVRIAGLLSDVSMDMQSLLQMEDDANMRQKRMLEGVPVGTQWGVPTLILPERLRSAFAFLPESETTVRLTMGDVVPHDKDGCEVDLAAKLIETLSDRFYVQETIFAAGSVPHGNASNPTVHVSDYIRACGGLNAILPELGTVTRLTMIPTYIMLAVNIVNVAHLNRIVRKREYALLEIVGIPQRQKMVMLLYESLLYSVRSILYSLPISALGLLVSYMMLAVVVRRERLAMIPFVTAFFSAGAPADSLHAMAEAFRNCAGAVLSNLVLSGVIIFLSYLGTNIYLDMQMQRRTVLPVLKETPYK